MYTSYVHQIQMYIIELHSEKPKRPLPPHIFGIEMLLYCCHCFYYYYVLYILRLTEFQSGAMLYTCVFQVFVRVIIIIHCCVAVVVSNTLKLRLHLFAISGILKYTSKNLIKHPKYLMSLRYVHVFMRTFRTNELCTK